ncbi:hypothetical protein BAE44_0003385 [Dichanthelium oligosanthes]|uniref:Uncharacterized protein n=1 Tax=Dichanthelium oligosanthes TaxID=888268 RepID=A0A1E5WDX6_9POAL|nr:hypothetical protein BAE44_0003385 [Dichanthelium oligosanthes]
MLDLIESITNHITDPNVFLRFKAVRKGWNPPHSTREPSFSPWIPKSDNFFMKLKSENVGEYRTLKFVSMVDNSLFRVSFPMLARNRSRLRLIGCCKLGYLLTSACNNK